MTKITTQIITVKPSEVVPNHENPRIIRDDKFFRLKESIENFPEMLNQIREIVVDENMMILGGNMRHKAVLELKINKITVKKVSGLTNDQKRELVIKDNVSSGQWDWDVITNNWDEVEVEDWGVEIPIESFEQNQESSSESPEKTSIKLDYSDKERQKVIDHLATIASTPEQAVWLLCGFKS